MRRPSVACDVLAAARTLYLRSSLQSCVRICEHAKSMPLPAFLERRHSPRSARRCTDAAYYSMLLRIAHVHDLHGLDVLVCPVSLSPVVHHCHPVP